MSRSFRACAAAFAAMIVVGVGSTRSAFAVATSDYAKKMTLTVNASRFAQSDGSIPGLPVPVRLSTAISGFAYDDVVQSGTNKDLYFVDGENNALPYEIEKWNEQGESIVWVRVPTFAAGAHIYMYYGGPAVEQNAAAVWSGYTGVWHMAEESGTVADATGHEYDAVPGGNDASQNVATNGVLGNARVNCHSGIAYLTAQNTANLDLGDTFTISGWFNLETANPDGQPTLITPKRTRWDGGWDDNGGWGLRLEKNSDSTLLVRGRGDSGDGTLVVQNVAIKDSWAHVLVVYNGWTADVYVNGAKQTTYRSDQMTPASWVRQPIVSKYPITFGFNSDNHWDDGWSRPLWGSYDEIRLSDETLSASRIKAEYVSQAYADAFVYEVSEILTGSVTLADAVTSGIVSENGKNTLTVTANVTAINGENAKVFLAVGVSEPKDGDPALRMVGIITNEVTATGTTTFVWDGAVLGTKIAYAVMNVVGSTTNATALTVSKLTDTAEYFWIADAEGYWSDSTKWTTSVEDGLPRLGYPSYGSKFQTRWGSKTAVILVDAAYEDLQGGTTLGWRNDTITFRGTVEGAAIGYPETAGFGDGQYDLTHITLDGVSLTCGSYHVQPNSSLTMLNGAYLYTRWDVTVAGENASLFVGNACELYQYGRDGDRFQFSGENASIVISNGLVRAKSLRFGAKNAEDTGNEGKTPAGLRFEGSSPRLLISGDANIPLDIGADIPVVFCVPENGYSAAPIAKATTAGVTFAARESSITHGLLFSIDEKSPYLVIRAKFHQLLVDWTYNESSYTVNAEAIAFAATPGSGKTRFYFTPESEGTKNGVSVYCYGKDGFAVVVR